MAKKGKRYRELKEQVDRLKLHTVDEAISLVKQTSPIKFDETVDLASRLSVDARAGRPEYPRHRHTTTRYR